MMTMCLYAAVHNDIMMTVCLCAPVHNDIMMTMCAAVHHDDCVQPFIII